uniref:Putative secreted protein n=1 Tax=Ixodes ricinus TaxID=34613 RepID=A0A147BLY4_IXORI
MTTNRAIVTILWITSVLSEATSKSEHCDVPDKELIEGKLHKLLKRLPKEYVVTETEGTHLIPGAIFLGNTTIIGINHLKADRPFQTFCRGDDTVTLFSLRSTRTVRAFIPWSLCSGHNGTLISSADLIRYEGELITRGPGNYSGSSIEELTPVVLEHLNIGMTGGGRTLHLVVHTLGLLFSGPVRLLWVELMTQSVQDALKDTLLELEL